jgi:hypothetical protein
MGYKSFEDLEVYKAAREFRKKIYKLIKGLPPEENYNNTCIDEKYFPLDYLEDLKKEGYRVNKILNGYIAYLQKRKNETPG